MIFNKWGKNRIYSIERLLLLIIMGSLILFMYPRPITDITSVYDVLLPSVLGLIGLTILMIVTLITRTRIYAPFVILPLDWIITGTFIYYAIPETDVLLLLSLPAVIIITGILRLGSIIGGIQSVGVLLTIVVSFSLKQAGNIDILFEDATTYGPIFVILIVVAVFAIMWYSVIDDENSRNRIQVRRDILEARTRLENMQERVKSFAEMAANLTSTLNYDKILDAAMDISRLSIRHDPKHRIVGLALMVDYDNELVIHTARGLPHTDLGFTFPGKQGIIAEAINFGVPIVHSGGEDDPELGYLRSFANARTTLAIPLRSNYESYGVLVFASTMENAINEDHFDTLAAIGMQTAIALQNAVLYGSLQEEKERIIQIEENGRKALVRDLHDIPTQTIAAVAMQLSIIPMIADREPDRVRDEIENIRQMALRASEEIRHVMFTLRPLSLETQGLTAALSQLSDKMEKTYKQAMDVRVDPIAEASLSQDAQGTLFYLIEEAANNARKYAEADVIHVRVGTEPDTVVVTVQDDGAGFDVHGVGRDYESRGSFGMVNMRERAELVNGEFELDSAVGMGTTVTVRVPTRIKEQTRPLPALSDPADTKSRRSLRTQSGKKRREYTGPLSPSN